jgi:hypothetical protein
MDLNDSLPEPSEDEEDMLEYVFFLPTQPLFLSSSHIPLLLYALNSMAFGLTETSRLGCQITVTEDMDGVLIVMPSATRNFYVDGHVPKPH